MASTTENNNQQGLPDPSILVAEDNSSMRHMLRDMLKRLGMERVHLAEDGASALEILQNKHVDLILCDWYMPRMGGREVLHTIRSTPEWKDIPFIVITGETKQAVVARAGDDEADGYIIKPFNMVILAEKIQTALGRKYEPSYIEQRLKNGYRQLQDGNLDQAEAEFESALMENPRSPRSLFALGQLQEQRGNQTSAMDNYEMAVGISPEFLKARDALARLLTEQGRQDEAASHLKSSVAVSPENARRQLFLGQALTACGEQEAARKALKKSFSMADELGPNAIRDLGESFLETGLDAKAEDCFQMALARDPGDIHTYNRLGIAFRKQGKFQEAVDNYLRAIEQAPEMDTLYFNLGRAYMDAKDQEKAEKAMRKALELNPEFNEAKNFLIKVLGAAP